MPDALFAALLAEQTPSGAFPSAVDAGDGHVADETCFVTAQVALILCDVAERAGPGAAPLTGACERALDFIERCAAPDGSGAFSFYPPGETGARLDLRLPPDADDTALAWLALMRGGRRPRAAARARLPGLFSSLSVRARRRGDPPFVRAALYRTWFDPPGGEPSAAENPVDLIVNVNIVACLAEAGCDPAESRATVSAIAAACAHCDLSRSSLRSFAPYYADPTEVEIALARAVDRGAEELRPALEGLNAPGLDGEDRTAGRPVDRPLYCNAHGRPIWRSASLQRARRCRDRLSCSS